MIWNKKVKKSEVLYAPLNGKYVALEQIPDPVFATGMMGVGCGIEPRDGNLVSPAAGEIVSVAETKHAVGIKTESGAELLIHIGMDTVEMKGRGFRLKVSEGERVTCGQPLIDFDIEAIRLAGFPVITAFVITNPDEFSSISLNTGKVFRVREEFGVVEV